MQHISHNYTATPCYRSCSAHDS